MVKQLILVLLLSSSCVFPKLRSRLRARRERPTQIQRRQDGLCGSGVRVKVVVKTIKDIITQIIRLLKACKK